MGRVEEGESPGQAAARVLAPKVRGTLALERALASEPLDFFLLCSSINALLGGMIIKVRSDIEEVSPWIKLLDRYASQSEDRLINFSLGKARASAWLRSATCTEECSQFSLHTRTA